ncbi:MAG: VTT domain-containing protein [Methylacidiphilales bacterium]|nr:VTT domain-containing protein [Candidatus Methylacidiphilales bacterium]
MNESPHAWWDFGYAGIFGCVFLEQIGVPIPAFPALLAAGALAASGELNLPVALAVAVAASLLADIIWYGIGRVRGGKVLNLMCRLSWKPDTCVSKTKILFSQHGTKTLLFAKFVPGLSTLAPPLAGIAQVPFPRFVFFDGAGTVLWALIPLIAGAYLQISFASLQERAYSLIPDLPWICGALILAVLVWRYVNRSRYLLQLRDSLLGGISADDLQRALERGEEITVIDVRDELSAKEKPLILPQARWIPYTDLTNRLPDLALDKLIVVYCDCPRDQAAVAMAQFLRDHGAKQVRPLRGGLEAWIRQGFATAELFPAATMAA